MKMSLKHLFGMALVLTLTATLPTLSSVAAEITCLSFVGPYATQLDSADLTDLAKRYPSGRRPSPNTCQRVLIKGKIVLGDAAKFAQIVHISHPFLHSVLLWSSGGSVEEAMRIGRLIRNGLIETTAP